MRHRIERSLILLSVLVLAGATTIQGRAAETSKASGAKKLSSPATLITKNSVGPIRLGMSVAQARKAVPKLKFARTTDGEGMALIEVKGGETADMVLYAGEDDAEGPIHENAKIQLIKVFGQAYKTANGVHPGMPLREVEKKYGKLTNISMSEIESREYAEFARQPAGLLFQVGLPEIGIAGKYPEGKRETAVYVPSAVVTNIEIY